jgi:hypothetical protein
MIIRFRRLGKLFGPETFLAQGIAITYTSNPVAYHLHGSLFRIYFNSRDTMNRSEVWSVDFDLQAMQIVESSLKVQLDYRGKFPQYCQNGISLGSVFTLSNERFIGFMGWYVPHRKHWVGEIGRLRIDSEFNLELFDSSPWIGISPDDPVSLSYPAVQEVKGGSDIWYGTTRTWDAGNGEMLHTLERSHLDHYGAITKTQAVVPYQLGEAQAFSRPSLINAGGVTLFSYSFRGNQNKYQIAVRTMEAIGESVEFGEPSVFSPGQIAWENEMVEYPYMVQYQGKIFMLYNGNSFGKSGIGLAEIELS